MTFGTNDNGATITLTSNEREAFLHGEPVVKKGGDSQGVFTITLKLTRPRSTAKRFPHGFDPTAPNSPH